MERLKIDRESVRELLLRFIRDYTEKAGFSRVVLGLSGGLDSSVAACLAVAALGNDNVLGVFLPHRQSHPDSLKDARGVADLLKITTRSVDITPLVEPFQTAFPRMNQLQVGNVMARCRMIALYQISAEEKALVIGTSNKSEILLGYGTLHGDLAAAFLPLGDLYKTQVRALAEHLGVPEAILRKTPSADLWKGQSDEGELGLTYAEADRFFVRWLDGKATRDELIADGFQAAFIDKITRRVAAQRFKSVMPPIPRITTLAVGNGVQHPRE